MDKVDKLLVLQSTLESIQQSLKAYDLEIVPVGAYRRYHLAETYELPESEDRSQQEGFAVVFKDWR